MSEVATYRVEYGGLMRCCAATLDKEMMELSKVGEPLGEEGDVVTCDYCDTSMICTDDGRGLVWRWQQ